MSNLWIRSQTRIALTLANDIYIRSAIHIKDDKNQKVYQVLASEKLVGEYETKERALEVLDEIQSFLVGDPRFVLKNFTAEDADTFTNEIKAKSCAVLIPDEPLAIMPINDGNIVYEMPLK